MWQMLRRCVRAHAVMRSGGRGWGGLPQPLLVVCASSALTAHPDSAVWLLGTETRTAPRASAAVSNLHRLGLETQLCTGL